MTIRENTLSWMLDASDLTKLTAVQYAVLVTADGLVHSWSQDLEREKAERIAAAVSGLHSLGSGMAREIGSKSGLRQIAIEFSDGFLFIREVANNAYLAVVTTLDDLDAEAVTTRMHGLSARMGSHLASAARNGIEGGTAKAIDGGSRT
ncbi:roadblock/LC7 domain-containing protein [Streptomyces sp. BK205]|uniref:roadblock/LC7 domain-containing protein n=1 Tax=Streptomyces sp. BK205 TaxID=2512164 RepID=UPI00104F09F7|nr:roadblock/LC7 domain-containing protein [Streptomyces sp. BK205]TCR22926.1 putative regulator of Ras-like GTPase activity (Roadblock/LC7/MglB family) [Streptomyces sp. BK205]